MNMIKTIVLIAHLNLQESRVNSALAQAAEKVESVITHYLYDLYPDGQIDVAADYKQYLEKLNDNH